MKTITRYRREKPSFPGYIVAIRDGDHYDSYKDDAKTFAMVCGVVLEKISGRQHVARFAVDRADYYCGLLQTAGVPIVLIDGASNYIVGRWAA